MKTGSVHRPEFPCIGAVAFLFSGQHTDSITELLGIRILPFFSLCVVQSICSCRQKGTNVTNQYGLLCLSFLKRVFPGLCGPPV